MGCTCGASPVDLEKAEGASHEQSWHDESTASEINSCPQKEIIDVPSSTLLEHLAMASDTVPPGKPPGKGVPPGKPPPGKGAPPGKPPPGKPIGKPPPPKALPGQTKGKACLTLEEQMRQKRGLLKSIATPAAETSQEKKEVVPAVAAAQEAERTELISALRSLAVNTTLGTVTADSLQQQHVDIVDGLTPLEGKASSMLGQGRFASVVQALVPVDTPGRPLMPVAAKRFAVSPAVVQDGRASAAAVPLSALRAALREADALNSIGPHPNIVQLLGVVLPQAELLSSQPPVQLLLRPSTASLHRLVTSSSIWEGLQRIGQLMLLVDAARGISAMHAAGFAHLDLKSHNVLVDRQAEGTWSACICDLGSAYRVHVDAPPPPAEGTAGWTAPEILDESPASVRVKVDARLADVFSFGVLIWEMVTGPGSNHPLNHLAGEAYVEALARGRRPAFEPEKENWDESLLAAECWQYEAPRRPSILKVVDRLMHRLAVLENNAANARLEQE